ESHAASFALLVYVSAWLKCHEPAVFTCALLNSQPMGFYAPAQLVQSARRAGVEVRPVAVNSSDWDSSLEAMPDGRHALRLGLRLVSGLGRAAGDRIMGQRADRPYQDAQDLHERTGLPQHELGALAAAGALAGIAGHRHRARWAVAGAEPPLPVWPVLRIAEGIPLLRPPSEGQDIAADYQSLGLTLGRHPLALLRARLHGLGISAAMQLQEMRDETAVHTAGIVTTRQRPGSAGGVTFVTLEDETGYVNVIVWRQLGDRQRRVLLESRLLGVRGRVQRQGDVLHVVAAHLEDHSELLGQLPTRSRDFS
ncbi:MAG: OB-fold nucleic acid binding domain-containing protein, partial [Gammaproteobacteria bacterium]